jgi:hypothetical protein
MYLQNVLLNAILTQQKLFLKVEQAWEVVILIPLKYRKNSMASLGLKKRTKVQVNRQLKIS